MKITPTFISNLETSISAAVTNGMGRVQSNLMWDKVMASRTSATKKELVFFLLETAKIYDQQNGGQQRFDDLAAKYMEFENFRSGAALKLGVDELEDNVLRNGGGMATLDYAGQWANNIGAASAYYPQEKMFELITGGTAVISSASVYDGLAFFSASHPINPVVGASGGTYSNLIASKPIDYGVTVAVAQANLASVLGTIAAYTMPNGIRRFLKPKYLMHAPEIAPRVTELLTSRYVDATENIGFTSMGIVPLTCAELTGKDWYLACEPTPGEAGALVFQERAPYVLNTFAPESSAQLMSRKDFEWDFSGRNAIGYGHPYLLVKAKEGA